MKNLDVKNMEIIIQQFINGLFLGSVYALMALGYTMVYGIINLINFAHGEIYMIGSFIGYFLIHTFNNYNVLPNAWGFFIAKIGRASCRERVYIEAVDGFLQQRRSSSE